MKARLVNRGREGNRKVLHGIIAGKSGPLTGAEIEHEKGSHRSNN